MQVNKDDQKWFDKGYQEQEWGYPLLDHSWGNFANPKRFQAIYRAGQVQAFIDGKAKKPWFYWDEDNKKK